MKQDELQSELRGLKFTHLTESELAAYCDRELDQIGRARVEAHLKLCFICERELELLREESVALANHAITPEDIALVERLTRQAGLAPEQSPVKASQAAREISLGDRVAEYARQMVASWRLQFSPVWRGVESEEVWQWQSEDDKLRARATLEKADLVIHISSSDMALEGTSLRFRLGLLDQASTLKRISESEVGATVTIPWQYRQGKMMTDISVEIG